MIGSNFTASFVLLFNVILFLVLPIERLLLSPDLYFCEDFIDFYDLYLCESGYPSENSTDYCLFRLDDTSTFASGDKIMFLELVLCLLRGKVSLIEVGDFTLSVYGV